MIGERMSAQNEYYKAQNWPGKKGAEQGSKSNAWERKEELAQKGYKQYTTNCGWSLSSLFPNANSPISLDHINYFTNAWKRTSSWCFQMFESRKYWQIWKIKKFTHTKISHLKAKFKTICHSIISLDRLCLAIHKVPYLMTS